jgi:hypothetical protein
MRYFSVLEVSKKLRMSRDMLCRRLDRLGVPYFGTGINENDFNKFLAKELAYRNKKANRELEIIKRIKNY